MKPSLRSLPTSSSCRPLRAGIRRLRRTLATPVYFGRCLAHVPDGSLVFFPLQTLVSRAALRGSWCSNDRPVPAPAFPLPEIVAPGRTGAGRGLAPHGADGRPGADYLGGDEVMESLWQIVQGLKRREAFGDPFRRPRSAVGARAARRRPGRSGRR